MISERRGVILVFGLIILGKATGFLKDLCITYYHGVSLVTDSYFLSNSIASLVYLPIYASIPALVVPMYSRLRAGGEEGHSYLSAGLFFFFLVSMVIGLVVAVGAENFVEIFSEGGGELSKHAASYLSLMALGFALSSMVAFYNAVQTVHAIAAPSYAAPIVNNIAFCLGLALFSSPDEFSMVLIFGLGAWSVLALLNAYVCRSFVKISAGAALNLFHDRRFVLLLLPSLLSFYIEQVNGYVGTYFASVMQTGAISILGYSNKLNMLFLSVFLVFLTATLFPTLSALRNSVDRKLFESYLRDCVSFLIIASIPVVLYMSLYSHQIIGLLFERGKFGEGEVDSVSTIFAWLVLGLPFMLLRDFMNRVFFSNENTITPAFLSAVGLGANFVVCYFGYDRLGLLAIVAASVFSAIVTCLLAFLFMQYQMEVRLVEGGGRVLSLCILVAGCASAVTKQIESVMALHWSMLAIPFFAVYCLLLLLLGGRDVRSMASKTLKFLVASKLR